MLGVSLQLSHLDIRIYRVDDISKELSISVNLSHLRKSIHRLQRVSIKLDDEKERAEARFKKWLHKVLEHNHSHVCHRFAAQIREFLGLDHNRGRIPNVVSSKDVFHYIWGSISDIAPAHGRHSHWKKLIKAAKHVHNVNKKLIAFEQGFISEDGIKDREWYRHLGVAPGKWLGHLGCTLYENKLLTNILLGYGATTFPALTESLTIEKNASLAQHEAERLTDLLTRLSHVIHP